MDKSCIWRKALVGLLLLFLMSGCDPEEIMPPIRKTDVIIEGRITTDGGARPMANMQVVLSRDRPLSLDIDQFYTKTNASGYFLIKFKANHELSERRYLISYDISNVDNNPYFCPPNYFSIGNLPSADTTLLYNF